MPKMGRHAMTIVATAVIFLTGVSSASAAPSVENTEAKATAHLVGSLRGSARLEHFTPGDDVRFSVNAHASYPRPAQSPYPATATGTARFYHWFSQATPPVAVWAEISVDCLVTGGNTATVTGFVVDASPQLSDWEERKIRLGFSVVDNGKGGIDRVGFSGPTDRGEPLLQECMAPAAYFPVKKGGYTVRDAGLVRR